MPTVTLNPGREERLAGGHLWIYAGEIRSIDGRAEPGDIVDVRAADRTFIGRGYINPRSTIAVRLLTRRKEAIDEGVFRRRVGGGVGRGRRRGGGGGVCRFGRASSPARRPPRRRSRNPVCGFGWISPPVRRPDFSLTSGRTAWPWPDTRAATCSTPSATRAGLRYTPRGPGRRCWGSTFPPRRWPRRPSTPA